MPFKVQSNRQAKTLPTGFHCAEVTLYLCVKESGSRSWVQRIRIKGRRYERGLGSFPLISLERARKTAIENRLAVYEGRNPFQDSNGQHQEDGHGVSSKRIAPTFETMTMEYHELNAPGYKNQETARQWLATFQNHVFPVIGSYPVDTITSDDVLKVLQPIWKTVPTVAKQLRKRLPKVLNYSRSLGHVSENVADERVDVRLGKNGHKTKHHKAIVDAQEIQDAYKAIDKLAIDSPEKRAVQFLIHTGARKGEVRKATWSEIDFDNNLWTLSDERMKAGKEHRVALSSHAVEILKDAQANSDGSDYVFPSAKFPGQMLSDRYSDRPIKESGLKGKTTIHGWRSSFKTWGMEQTDHPREVIEAALAHALGSQTEQAYMRGDMLEKRRAVMEAWSDFLAA